MQVKQNRGLLITTENGTPLSPWDLSKNAQRNRPACTVLNLWWNLLYCTNVYNGLLAIFFILFYFLNHEHFKGIAVTFGVLRYSRLRASCISLWETAVDLHKLSERADEDYWLRRGKHISRLCWHNDVKCKPLLLTLEYVDVKYANTLCSGQSGIPIMCEIV